MRLLSDAELREVFGGQDATSAITLSTVNVNANISANPTYSFAMNPSDTTTNLNPTSESGGSHYLQVYKALATPPSPAHIKCLVNASADAGKAWDPNYQLFVLDDYAQMSTNSLDNVHLSPTKNPNLAYNLHGLTETTSTRRDTVMTAGGVTPFSGVIQVMGKDGNIYNVQVNLTAAEQMIRIGAHEAAHQHGLGTGPTNEAIANEYGMDAVFNYRNGAGASCP